jgi:hypothetical protein
MQWQTCIISSVPLLIGCNNGIRTNIFFLINYNKMNKTYFEQKFYVPSIRPSLINYMNMLDRILYLV